MKIMTKLTTFFAVLILYGTLVNGQELHKDGSMKLTAISTDKKYGYKPNHKTSIKVGTVENEYAYLKALRGPNGEKVQYRRIGSCCTFKSKNAIFGEGLLDQYEVYYQGIGEPIILYLNGYDFEMPKSPLGFTFVTANKIE